MAVGLGKSFGPVWPPAATEWKYFIFLIFVSRLWNWSQDSEAEELFFICLLQTWQQTPLCLWMVPAVWITPWSRARNATSCSGSRCRAPPPPPTPLPPPPPAPAAWRSSSGRGARAAPCCTSRRAATTQRWRWETGSEKALDFLLLAKIQSSTSARLLQVFMSLHHQQHNSNNN